MDTNIRTATLHDIDFIQRCGRALYEVEKEFEPKAVFFGEQYQARDLKELSNPDALMLIADYDARPSGYLYAYTLDMPDHLSMRGKECVIEVVHLETLARGKGLADMLIRASIRWAKSKNVKRIRAGIYAQNTFSVNAFARSGFDPYHITMMKSLIEEPA